MRAEHHAARDVAEDQRLAQRAGEQGESGGGDDAEGDRREKIVAHARVN